MREYCSEITEKFPLEVELVVDIDDKLISEKIAISLFRVVQESLNNVLKHAKANKVKIKISQEDALQLEITDNGIGFEVEKAGSNGDHCQMGLVGMQERIESLGGTFIVNSLPGKGTCVKIVMDCSTRNAKESDIVY